MKIESSNVLLASQHSAMEKRSVRESLRMWIGEQRPDPSTGFRAGFEGQGNGGRDARPAADAVSLSAQAKAAAAADPAQQAAAIDPEKELEKDPRFLLIKLMLEALTGEKIKLARIEDANVQAAPAHDTPDPKQAAQAQPQRAGFGVEYDYHETRYEAEQTNFSAQGVIKTADGKEISFKLELAMSREHYEETNTSLRLGDAVKKDPLVINFGGTAAQLTDAKFSFDLNADGKAEQISFVGPNSGFLALDKNGDGKIDKGGELFGPASGNGFQELAAYDQDKNGWIDENDTVYQKLQVWTKDAKGNDTLGTLAQKNVGALYLGSIGTPFDIKNNQNQLDGQIKSSGVYLKEDGGAGSMQQIDLTI